ncbi:MAG: methionyl-tRNA formyltransferase [Planctomycetota bacterium]
MRLAFFGSGAFGLPTIESLHAQHDLALVVTQPDRPAGRKQKLTPTPIGAWALERGVPIERHDEVNRAAFVERLAAQKLDASVVIAFGQKLGEPLIDAMGKLAMNLHGSILPAYRGAAPVQRAVMDGLPKTGVSVIGLAQRMDAGLVYGTAELDIRPTDTSGDVHDRLAELGPEAVGRVLAQLADDALSPTTQDESQATRARKLTKAEGTVDFAAEGMAATRARAWINGLNPWPGCRVVCVSASGNRRELILRRVVDEPAGDADDADSARPGTVLDRLCVATRSGLVRLLELQAPGSKQMPAEAFAAGHGLAVGDRLEPWLFPS